MMQPAGAELLHQGRALCKDVVLCNPDLDGLVGLALQWPQASPTGPVCSMAQDHSKAEKAGTKKVVPFGGPFLLEKPRSTPSAAVWTATFTHRET